MTKNDTNLNLDLKVNLWYQINCLIANIPIVWEYAKLVFCPILPGKWYLHGRLKTTNIFCKSGSNFEIGQTVRLNLTGLKLWVYSARLCGGRAELSDRMGKTRPPMSAKDSTRKFRQKGCQHKIGRDQFSCVFFAFCCNYTWTMMCAISL